MRWTESEVSRPQQWSEDDIRSFQVHEVVIVIIILILVFAQDQAAPQTPHLSVQWTGASHILLTVGGQAERQ